MMHRCAALTFICLTAACSPDLETIGRAPPLSPVGSGVGLSARTKPVEEVAALSQVPTSWVGGSADYFRDARASRVGDIITVKIAINDRASLNNTSNRSRKSSTGGNLGFNYDVMGVVGADLNGKGNINSNSSAEGQGSTERSERVELSIAAVVTQLLPNGYLLIEGSQEVLVNFEQRTLRVAGLIRPADIAPDNSISYEKIAEARIAYGGQGRVSEVQQPGWGQQIWDRLSPF